MRLSEMVLSIEPSLTRKLFNMAKNYSDVIDLTLGDPDFSPSENIKKAAIAAILAGNTHYSANAGLPELRKKYVEFVNSEYGSSYSEENVLVSVGGMEALFLTLASIVNKGDEVIIFGPYYVNYFQMTKMLGGVPVVVNALADSKLVIEELKCKVSERTTAIIINSPCNPTGRIVDQSIVDAVASLSMEHDFYVISDEVYSSLVYEGVNTSIIRYPECRDRSILIDSVSKRFSMTGYRLGFAVADAGLIAAMTKMQENVAACAPLPSQYAAIEAYSSQQTTKIRDAFKKRRDSLCSVLSKTEKLSFEYPSATFYLFVDISHTGFHSEEFCYKLLEEKHVAVVPGKAYGGSYDSFVRIAFTQDVSILVEAASRIVEFVEACR